MSPQRDNRGRPRILFIYKKSAYQTHVREAKDEHILRLIEEDDPTVRNVISADADHVQSIEEAKEACRKLGIRGVFRHRSDEISVEDFEFVVTIGGDGTLLWASHRVSPAIPILAINSAPNSSVGYFCGGRKGDIAQSLSDALAGRLRETRLTRMEVSLDGKVLDNRVLNDALFCHRSPAATTRYIMEYNGLTESQKSSGIWIAPAAGSTAAIRSAGGRIQPPASRRLQFVVREPYEPPEGGYRHRRGLIAPDESLKVLSKVRRGQLFLDGPHRVHNVNLGGELIFRRSPQSLTLLSFPRAERS